MSSTLSASRPHPLRSARGGHAPLSPLSLSFAVLGIGGMAALWVLATLFLQSLSAWMALIVAADIALLLRIAGSRTGRAFGYGPLDGIQSLGPDLAWTLALLGHHGPELALYALAIALAWWLGR